MESKECSKCCEIKLLKEFNKSSQHKSGLNNQCKNCINNYNSKFRFNKSGIKRKPKKQIDPTVETALLINNFKICHLCNEIKSLNNFLKNNVFRMGFSSRCKACMSVYRKNHHIKNKNRDSFNSKNWSKNHPMERKKINRISYEKNKNKILERRRNNPLIKLKCNLRSRISDALKRNKGKLHTFQIIGMSYDNFKKYIELKFQNGMTWENYGKYKNNKNELISGWDIDHVILLNSAKTKEELIKLCHYTNLQPLWHIDNLVKGQKLE